MIRFKPETCAHAIIAGTMPNLTVQRSKDILELLYLMLGFLSHD